MSSPGTLRFAEINVTPSPPPAGYSILYVKTDEVLYLQDSTGTETPLGSAAAITQLIGEATAIGPGVSTITLSNSAVIGKVLTGFVAGPNSTVLATDTLLQAIQKLQSQVNSTTGSAITSLTGDVSATGPGSATATVNSVGGSSAANINTATIAANSATASNTASTIVKRDASGNFAANTITAALNGNATTATTSTNFSGSLVGDVIGTQGATVVSTVGGKTAAQVSTSVNDTLAATSSNTASTIVKRDASGNFSASTITATLNGNASTSTNFTGLLTGDVSGTQTTTSVDKIKGTSVNPTAPTDAEFLVYQSGFVAYKPVGVSGDASMINTGDMTVNFVGGSSAANINAAEIAANAATASNISSTIVKRDGSGNFSAGSITADLIGVASGNVAKTGDSMSGDLNMTGNAIVNLEDPINPSDAASKSYVDNLAVGIIPQEAILANNIINDTLNTPPVSPIFEESYIIGPTPTGAWATIGAGYLTCWNGSVWIDCLMRAVQPGDRFGVNFEQILTPGGGLTGKQNYIVTVVNNTPGFFTYTDEIPEYRWTTFVDNQFSPDFGNTFYYNGTEWSLLSTGFVPLGGDGIAIVGVTIDVLFDDTTIDINGSNQLEIKPLGVNTAQLANNSVTNTKLAQMPSNTIKGNNTGGLSDPLDLTVSQVVSMASSTVVTQLPDQSNFSGTAPFFSRADHVHNIPSGTPVQIGTANFSGSSASFSLSDHVHAHGNQTSATLHAIATGAANGFMSSTDKTKLDNATSANTPSTLVLRDSSGNFSAGTITANLTGDATNFTGPLLGDVNGTQSSTVIATGAVTDTKTSLAVKPAVTVVSITNQALTGTPTIDGQTTIANQSIVLLTAQSTGSQNGPWIVQTGAWTRPTWYPTGGTTQSFQFITTLVRLGTVYGGSVWRQTTAAPVTIDTTSTTWIVTPVSGNYKTTYTIGPQSGTSEVDLVYANSTPGTLAWNPTASHKLTLPPTQGVAGTYLSNNGSGILTWTSPVTNIDGGTPETIFVIGLNINGGTP